MDIFRIKKGVYSRIFRVLFRNSFKFYGRNTSIVCPLSIDGMRNISLGNNVYVAYRSWLAALPLTGSKNCLLSIGEGTRIGNFNHIFATESVVLGKNVLTADKVYISDNAHIYEDILTPISMQPIRQISHVFIDDGSWLGENVCVLGAKIGKNCVIGANSVVTKDIPDFCVAVGSPAKIIKRFCKESGIWKKADSLGNFI